MAKEAGKNFSKSSCSLKGGNGEWESRLSGPEVIYIIYIYIYIYYIYIYNIYIYLNIYIYISI